MVGHDGMLGEMLLALRDALQAKVTLAHTCCPTCHGPHVDRRAYARVNHTAHIC